MKQDSHTRYQVQKRSFPFGETYEPVSRKFKTFEGAQNAADNDGGKGRVVDVPADGYHFEDCRGEAHSNAFIDHCMVCMPMWGQVVVKDEDDKPNTSRSACPACGNTKFSCSHFE